LVLTVWGAWAILAVCAVRFNGTSGFPGWHALVPVLAAAAVIWVGDLDHSWAPTGLTSFGPVQFLGGISYSVYLWHWPLIILAPALLHREIYARDKIVILGVTLLLAYLSKRYIEDPARSPRLTFLKRSRTALVCTALIMAALLAITTTASAQMGARAQAASRALFQQSQNPDACFGAQAALSGARCPDSHVITNPDSLLLNWGNQHADVINGSTCPAPLGSSVVRTCSFGAPLGTQTTNVALIGDSHAAVWATTLSSIAEARHLHVQTFLGDACPATLDPGVSYSQEGNPANRDACVAWREAAIAKITADPSIDVVVTSSVDRLYLGARDASGLRSMDSGNGYVKAWSQWLAAGKRVVVINEVPEHNLLIPSCIARSASLDDPCTMPAATVNSPGPLASAAAKMHNANFTFVNFQNVFCDTKLCHSVIGGLPAYLDGNHLTAPFARSFASAFMSIRALSNNN
jgi:hypothetical protein